MQADRWQPSNMNKISPRCIAADIARLTLDLPDIHQQGRLLVDSASHSGDCLHWLLTLSRGLCLNDEAVRYFVGLRLVAKVSEPHQCSCDAKVDPEGPYGLTCKTQRRQNYPSSRFK